MRRYMAALKELHGDVPRLANQLALLDEIERDIAEARTHQRAKNKKRTPKASVLLGLRKPGDFA